MCRYRRLPIYDNTSQTITMYLGGCVSFIKEGHCYGNVLVHCAQGVSRSVSVVLAYLMAEAGLTLGDALAMCKKARPQVGVASPCPLAPLALTTVCPLAD